ncbi:hypothetical protein BCV70DRAFT_204064 [Testicularia cyperi]|uniref:C2H2-type domain-containing protein n=1 Tax=Testicularia cyperi TaxID=1882483 RepID=A0A317XY83_9BASI|nr:hypothetical protein BCV70DRAFT_204064 [Testicularia cyperi]
MPLFPTSAKWNLIASLALLWLMSDKQRDFGDRQSGRCQYYLKVQLEEVRKFVGRLGVTSRLEFRRHHWSGAFGSDLFVTTGLGWQNAFVQGPTSAARPYPAFATWVPSPSVAVVFAPVRDYTSKSTSALSLVGFHPRLPRAPSAEPPLCEFVRTFQVAGSTSLFLEPSWSSDVVALDSQSEGFPSDWSVTVHSCTLDPKPVHHIWHHGSLSSTKYLLHTRSLDLRVQEEKSRTKDLHRIGFLCTPHCAILFTVSPALEPTKTEPLYCWFLSFPEATCENLDPIAPHLEIFMGSFSLPSAGGVVSLLNDRAPPPYPPERPSPFPGYSRNRPYHSPPSMSQSAFDATSSSTESLLRSGDRSTASTSPPTSVDYSIDSRASKAKGLGDSVRLPRIEVPGESLPPRHGLQGHKVLRGAHISASPKILHTRPGDPLPPSTTGVFPPGQWDRAGAYLDPSGYSRRSSSSSSDSMMPFDRAGVYGDTPNGHISSPANSAKRGKEGGSGAITVGGKKRYPCQHPGCDKTFSTSGHAARHNRIHTGQKPYRCTFPGCKARFSRQDNSLQHYRTHILHPKGRASQSVQARDAAAQLDLSHMDMDAADAEAEAKAELGRRALEDGTAIAVVHDVKDQHGRKKGETIERMVGMPRSRRESLRSGMLDEDRSTSPSSIDDGRPDRQNSLPGSAIDAGPYETPGDYWSSQLTRQGRLSLPHSGPAMPYDARYRDPVPPAPYGRDAAYPASSTASWAQSQASYLDPRFGPGYARTNGLPPPKRDIPDPLSRASSAALDPELRYDMPKSRAESFGTNGSGIRPDEKPLYGSRYEGDLAEQHRRSASMGSSNRERAMAAPSSSALPPLSSRMAAASAPGSVMPSARSSQSPKSSPTSTAYSVPEGIAASALDRLSAAAASSAPAPPASTTRGVGRLMGSSAGSLSTSAYQHPYSSDRSTNLTTSLPPISSARDRADDLDLDRKTMSSGLRSGLSASDPKITLPPLNPAPRRW